MLGHPDAQGFGRKFKIAFSGCRQEAWPDEQVRIGTLGQIHTESAGLSSPAILVLGNVIAFGRQSHPN